MKPSRTFVSFIIDIYVFSWLVDRFFEESLVEGWWDVFWTISFQLEELSLEGSVDVFFFFFLDGPALA